MLKENFSDAVTLWVVIDPIGTIPLFLIATAQLSQNVARRVALRGVLIAAGILLGFMVLGQILLEAMGISVQAFQVAGGIILFVFAIKMCLGEMDKEENAAARDPAHIAVFPVAMPSIAGPGSILSIVMLTDNDRFGVFEQARTGLVLLVVLLIQYVLLLAAGRVQRLLGDTGIHILTRIMGLILSAVAVQNVVTGVQALFKS